MGFFISILRERIANFDQPARPALPEGTEARALAAAEHQLAVTTASGGGAEISGISINDLRKNLRALNDMMDHECASSVARYGVHLDASLITEISSPAEVESALAAINTAHNHVSSDISLAQASADQRIVLSRRAVEIETLRAQAEVEPLRALSDQLGRLRGQGPDALTVYLRNLRLGLYDKADRAFLEAK